MNNRLYRLFVCATAILKLKMCVTWQTLEMRNICILYMHFFLCLARLLLRSTTVSVKKIIANL